LRQLEIRPDVIVGHSTGDYSAMLAANIIDLSDRAYVEAIVQWNQAHRRLTERMAVPEATLIAVAADSATVASIIEAVGKDLSVAMDNCPHQSVLVGSKIAAEQAIDLLRRRGIIYEILPFDRPYHTPMFQAYAEGAGTEFFARLPIAVPRTEIYSCTTASRYPADIEEIRKLFVAHWVQPVLFTETVRKMYDDGVRLFVEAGPRGNLTAFVSDILRGRPHLAMPANLPRRSGLTQINHLVGALAAQRAGMRLDYLYARRDPQNVSWEKASAGPSRKQPVPMKLSLALPAVKVSPRRRKVVSADANGIAPEAQIGAMREFPRHSVEPNFEPSVRPSVTMVAQQNGGGAEVSARQTGSPVALALPPVPARTPGIGRASAQVMQEYLKGMDAFLDVESNVMGAFLNRRRPAKPGNGTAPIPEPRDFPLLGEITSIVPGQELTALRELNQDEDLFLRDHALGGQVSVREPELKPMVVLPLTMSMEILAEAATALMPGHVLVAMRDIKAHQWIRVDDARVRLEISARRIPNSSEVSVRIGQKSPMPVIEGIMVFAGEYAAAPAASGIRLSAERASRLASTDLYDGRIMFHGPSFQGVVSVDRSGQDGLIGQLCTLPTGSLFRSVSNPRFVTDPVVLDAAGQLVGFWAAEYLQSGFVVFPYHLETLRIYGPKPGVGERLRCSVKLQLQGKEGIRSDIEIARADGTVWMDLQGWADRRFDPPRQLYRAWIAPFEATISEPWQIPVPQVPDRSDLECYGLESFLKPGTGLFKDLWASLVLSRQERKAFEEQRGSEDRQIEWLAIRTAAKDAVGAFLRKNHGLKLLPADIEIEQDEEGRAVALGPWTQEVRGVPELCIAHAEGLAVALAGRNGRHLGVHVHAIRDPEPDLEPVALTSNERQLLEGMPQSIRAEWLLRLWCAKEAVSKALGPGTRSVRVLALNAQTGVVAATSPEAHGEELLSYTARHGAWAVASAIFGKKTS
jgi:malonyl CoA-acyl carrier protein transacylase/phosphopantetheinyl transferase